MSAPHLFLAAWLWLPLVAQAAPFKPASDAQVLEVLPARLDDARQRELRALRARVAAEPRNPAWAVALARRYFDAVAAEGDPRYVGYAQAALAPWWDVPDAPAEVRVMRAMLRQFSHEFDAARADLRAALQQQPDNGEAWAWLAAVNLVQADYAAAREACAGLARHASALIGTACAAQVDSLTGRARDAATTLRAELQRHADAPAAERLWVLTRLGEAAARHGDAAGAEAAYRQALALGIDDGYLLAVYADLLLDQQRPAEVLALLRGRERSDLLLLRLALAARASGDPAAARWTAELAARFDAARRRGDALHQKEEARFALALQGQPQRALALAQANFALQREPVDARMLLEAALAARQPAAARPALDWMAASGIDSVRLQALAAQLKALR